MRDEKCNFKIFLDKRIIQGIFLLFFLLFFTNERVRNGLANARAKGVRIGRLKTRDSDLIRKLRASGMTYRQIAMISKCSAGAVSAELRAMKAEKAKISPLTTTSEVTPIAVMEACPSTTHEIEMPYGEIKLELDFAS